MLPLLGSAERAGVKDGKPSDEIKKAAFGRGQNASRHGNRRDDSWGMILYVQGNAQGGRKSIRQAARGLKTYSDHDGLSKKEDNQVKIPCCTTGIVILKIMEHLTLILGQLGADISPACGPGEKGGENNVGAMLCSPGYDFCNASVPGAVASVPP